MEDTINTITLIKGKEKYMFLYSNDQTKDVILRFGQFASHPELSFSWYDSAVLSQKVRRAERAARNPSNRLEFLA